MLSLLTDQKIINNKIYFSLYRFDKDKSVYSVMNKNQLDDVYKTDLTNFSVSRGKFHCSVDSKKENLLMSDDNPLYIKISETSLDIEEFSDGTLSYFKVLSRLINSKAEILILSKFYPMSQLVAIGDSDDLFIRYPICTGKSKYYYYIKAFSLNSDISIKKNSIEGNLLADMLKISTVTSVGGVEVLNLRLSYLKLYDSSYPTILTGIYSINNLIELYEMKEFYNSIIKGIESVKYFYTKKHRVYGLIFEPYKFLPKQKSYLKVFVERSSERIKINKSSITAAISDLKNSVPECIAKRIIVTLWKGDDFVPMKEIEDTLDEYTSRLDEVNFIIWKFRVMLKTFSMDTSHVYPSLFGYIKIKQQGG